jgi:uncharacterized protein YcfL
MKKIINYALIIAISSFSLFACGKKKETTPVATDQTTVQRTFELTEELTPEVNLTPRADGKEIKLSITNIDPSFSKIEYELIYTATSDGMEVEKEVETGLETDDYFEIISGLEEGEEVLTD